MDVHPPKNGMYRYWSIAIYSKLWMSQESLTTHLELRHRWSNHQGAQATTTTGRVEKRSMERIKFTAWSGARGARHGVIKIWLSTLIMGNIYGYEIWLLYGYEIWLLYGYEIWLMMVNNDLVGGWALALWKMMESVRPLEKYDHEVPNGKKRQVPNHQPENSCLLHGKATTKTGRSYWKSSIEIRDLWMFIWPEKPSEKPAKSRTLCDWDFIWKFLLNQARHATSRGWIMAQWNSAGRLQRVDGILWACDIGPRRLWRWHLRFTVDLSRKKACDIT